MCTCERRIENDEFTFMLTRLPASVALGVSSVAVLPSFPSAEMAASTRDLRPKNARAPSPHFFLPSSADGIANGLLAIASA